jgi:putative OPT family oligopeptide transporter
MPPSVKKHSFVSHNSSAQELTAKALIIGIIMSVILGAANAYLGLKAGMTIAATYPAAVIGMAVIRIMKGNILEENIARTIGSIGESVAAGAIFTIPAFFIAGIWKPFFTPGHYITSSLILIAGSLIGIVFVALLRRGMVEDKELPYPESQAAAEIHKAGQQAAKGSKLLFSGMLLGGGIKLLGELKLFPVYFEKFVSFTKQTITGTSFAGKGGILLGSPGISPAYLGVGYIIGPGLSALNFSGGLIAWGLLVPMFMYFMAPGWNVDGMAAAIMLKDTALTHDAAVIKVMTANAYSVWRFIVRPIAIGGMLVASLTTLFNMRKSLTTGIKRSMDDFKKSKADTKSMLTGTDQDIRFKWILSGIAVSAVITFYLCYFVFDASVFISLIATLLMVLLSFFFSAVAGYLVGMIGSSNSPVSGLTLTTIVVTALVMLLLGVSGTTGVTLVLAVAAIICVVASVAGEMLQDLKVGYILGGTPWKMEVSDILGIVINAVVMFGVLVFLNEGDIAKGIKEGYEGGFGSKNLAAPQAGLMALLSKGIIEGAMAWPLIIAGMLMGIGFIMMQMKSPMLVCIGMYLPLETTFAIFIGGMIKGIVDKLAERKNPDKINRDMIENKGILLASGLIAGEALMGLIIAVLAVFNIFLNEHFSFFDNPSSLISVLVLLVIAIFLILIPLRNSQNKTIP